MITYSAPASLSIARADLAGERAFALPVQVLRRRRRRSLLRAASATACSAVNGGATTISTSVDVLDAALRSSLTKTTASCTVLNIFQLPAMNGIRMTALQWSMPAGSGSSAYLSGSAATPGSVWPPRNSSDAPPPVEMWVIRSATPAFVTAAIESPPPMIVVPFTAATALATAIVPVANGVDLEHAHRAVPDDRLRVGDERARRASTVVGPMSRPMRSPIAGSPTVEHLGRRAGFELRRDDVIDRQLERDARAPSRAPRCRAPRRACRPRRATCRPAGRAP